MICCNCHSNDWENIDGMRIKPEGMSICKNCGFISYPNRWENEEKMKQYYSSAKYRRPPNSGNFFSGQQKIQFHENFLREFIEEWNKREEFVVCDVGAAFGMFLKWFSSVVPNSKIHGTEWDINFVRNAWHEYNVKLDADFDESIKYDLICSYKVAEHQLDFDKKLSTYRDCLKDDGMLYISAPTWFHLFHNFGPNDCELEYYYHPDHINVWSRNMFKAIINNAGFEIVKENVTMYDDTYMLKKSDTVKVEYKEDITEIKKKMIAIKQCYEAMVGRNFSQAIQYYPSCPRAVEGYYESQRAQLHNAGMAKIEEFMADAQAKCPNSSNVVALCADIYKRYEMYERSLDMYKIAIAMKPGQSDYFAGVAQCLRGIHQKTGEEKYLLEARKVTRYLAGLSTQNLPSALSWIYADNSALKTEWEK